MALRVINHYPSINAIDIPRNIYVKIEFNSGIIPGSLDYTHISVNDAANFTTVPGDLGLEYTTSGIASIISFQPIINLTANTKYRVYVFGAPNSVLSTTNEQLANTYSWEFTTGTSLLEGQMPAGIPSGELDLSGVVEDAEASGIYVPADTDSTTFYVVSTDPQNQEPNIPSGLSTIDITFNLQIATSLSDLSGYIVIEERDVLV
jgi:hypothetical protein